MFITRPREKKNALAVPPRKKRKADFTIEEINFDDSARSDYLTGFHKRKLQRQKHAQEIATQKARQEKIAFRKELKEQRQKDVEEHVRQVNEALRAARMAGGEEVTDEEEEEDDEEWGGIEDEAPAVPEFVDHEEEYIDEDKYTTVTVEAVDVDRDGMHALSGRHTSDSEPSEAGSDEEGEEGEDGTMKKTKSDAAADSKDSNKGRKKKEWPKKKKKKFRYESKIERALSRQSRKKR
ncbi:hypothetical protein SEUCBS139899_002326 [Sporothrix eucalyptigena]|uniref:Protein required for cell viability Rrp17 n=1 Tax=Sporothrix eucalyptigena TaxID=1812306 RepID=A0ABP0BV18_9PEZI